MSIGDITPRDAWKTFPRMALYHVTDQLAHQAATSPHNDLPEPTPEQKESGDYVKGHVTIAGLPIAIENPQWSTRSGVDADGKKWSVTMKTHYGYFKGTKGADGDEVDVILLPGTEPDFSGDVYVIEQIDPSTGEFDEHKVVLGAKTSLQAIKAYMANYSKGWGGFGDMATLSMDEFQEWLALPPDQMIFDSLDQGIAGITDEDIERDPLGVLGVCLSAWGQKNNKRTGKVDTKSLVHLALSRSDRDGNKLFAEIAPVSQSVADQVAAVIGEDVSGWVHGIDESAIRHIIKRHGDQAVETTRNQIAIRPEDIENIALVLNEPDSVEDGGKTSDGTKTIVLKKKIGGEIFCLQEVRKGRKKLTVKTLWKVRVVPPAATEVGVVQTSETSNRNDPQDQTILTQSDQNTITPTGRDNTVKTAKGTKVGTKFMVIEADQLITSHDASGNANPLFPQELQPRDRSRETSQAWVQKVAASLDPDSLGRTGRADSGAPIIGSDRVVESGNGRSMAIQLAYRRGTAEEYRQFIIDDAEYFGLDPDAIEAMNEPVLVRVRTTAIDRQVFTVEANQDDKLTFSATERARSDAKRLDANLIAQFAPGEDGDLLIAANQRFIQGFLKSLGDTESAQYMTTEGKPTKALVDRIKAAVFSKAYNDDRLLEMMADDTKPEIQNVLNALGAAAPRFIEAQAYGRIATETLSEQVVDAVEQSLDQRVIDAVVNATNVLLASRAVGQDITEYVRQQGLFEDIDEGVAALAVFLSKNGRSAKRMGIAFKAMAEFVKNDAMDQTNNGLFGEPVPPSMMDVVTAANRQLELVYGDDQGNNIGLFDGFFTKTEALAAYDAHVVDQVKKAILKIDGFTEEKDGRIACFGYFDGYIWFDQNEDGRSTIVIRDDGGEIIDVIENELSAAMIVRSIIDVLGIPISDVIETMFDSLHQPIDFTDSWFDGCIVRWSGQAQSEQVVPLPSSVEIGSMVTIGLYDKGEAVEMTGQIRAIKFRAGKVRYEVALPIANTCFASVIEVNSESVVQSGFDSLADNKPDSKLPSSLSIENMEQAQAYWRNNFLGKSFNLIVNTRDKLKDGTLKTIPIRVEFTKKNHAYTQEDPSNPSKRDEDRLFSLERAQVMERIFNTIEHPRVRLISRGNDLLLEAPVKGRYYAVFLIWRDARKVYEFDSAHFRDESQVRGFMSSQASERKNKNKGPLQK